MKNLKPYIQFLFFVVSIFTAVQAWGVSKTWTGGTGNWNTSGYWSPSGIPAADDIVIINSGMPEITTTVQVKSITIGSGATLKLTSGSLTVQSITNNGTFNATGGTFKFTGTSAAITGIGTTTCYDLEIPAGAALSTSSPITINRNLTNGGTFTANANITLTGEFTNNGTFNHGNQKVIFTGSGAKIKGSTETQFYNLEITSSGTLTLEKEIKIAGEFTNNGIFTHGNKAVTLDNTANIKITGTTTANNTKFYELKMTNAGGKKLELQNQITVEHDLHLTGTSKTSFLEISGTGEIHLTHTANTGKHLSIAYPGIQIKTATYSVAESKTTANKRPETQTDNGWFFTSMNFEWQGTSTDWNSTSNWNFSTLPAKYDIVTIPTRSYYPKLDNSRNATAKEVTVDTNAELDLNTEIIAAVSGNAKLTVNGTLKLTGTGSQKSWFENNTPENKLTLLGNTTVEYHTNTDATVYKGPYYTLIIKDGKKVSSTEAISATDCTVTGEINAALTVNNNLTASDSAKFKAATVTNNFTINGSTSGSETVLEGNVTTKNLTINTGRKLTANADISISGDFTNNGEFTHGNKKVTFTGADSKLLGSSLSSFYDLAIASGKLTVTRQTNVLNNFTASGMTLISDVVTVENDFVVNAGVTLNGALTSKNITIKNSQTLTANADITLTGNFENNGTFIDSGNKTVTCKGTPTKISGTSPATEFYNLKATTGNLTVDKKITVKNDFTADTDVTLNRELSAKNITINASKTLDAKANITVSGNFTNNGTFTHNNKKVIFNGSDTRINGSSGSQFYDLEVSAGKTLTTSSQITISHALTNNGTFTAASAVTLAPSGTDITITGSDAPDKTKFNSLVYSNAGGKTLILNKKITVTGNLTLSGSSDSSLLTVKTSTNAQLTLNADKTGGNYLDVYSNIPIANHTYTTQHSKIHEETGFPITAGNPKNWIFDGCISGTFYWKGAVNTNWETEKNWLPYCKPDERANLIIPKEGVIQFPKLTSNVKALSVDIKENAELDLNQYTINTTGDTAKLSNNGGILKLTGTNDQKNWFKNSNPNNTLSLLGNTTVAYYNGGTADIYHGNYYNLTIHDAKTISSDTALNVTHNFTANGTTTLTKDMLTKNVMINSGKTLIANKDITVSGDFTNDGTFVPDTKTVKFTGADSKLKGAADLSTFYNIIMASGKLTVEQRIAVLNNFTADGTAVLNKKADVHNTVIVNAAVTLNDALTAKDITINTAKTLTANADITVNGNLKNDGIFTHASDNTVIFKGASSQIHGAAPLTQFYNVKTESGSLTINQKIKAVNNFTAGAPVTTNTKAEVGNNFFVNADVTLGDEFISKNIIIHTLKTLRANANITITGNFTNAGKFKSISDTNLIFSGDVITITGGDNEVDTEFKNVICNGAKNKKLIFSKKIKVSGDLKLSGTAEGYLVIDGTHNAAIYLNGYQTGNAYYLKIHTSNIKINDGLFTVYYIVKNSVDYLNELRNKNGWVFYKTFAIENSFIRAGDNKLYIVIQEKMYENEFTYSKLEITDTVTHSVIAGGLTYQPYTTHTFTDTSYRTVWEYTLDKNISADTILNKNILIRLYYFDKEFSKKYISDIGINMIKVLFAANSRTIRDFSGAADLPKLNTVIPISSFASSQNIRLYFDYDKSFFWYPQLKGIEDAFNSKNPITADTESITTAEEFNAVEENGSFKFMIPSDTPNFKENSVAQFMFVYDGWLPCANLKNSSDPLSFDVWKFNVLDVASQRGGVSVYNNVINTNKDEKVSFQLTLQKAGTITIQIMTIDGSIVKTVERSHKAAGTHFYEWDGKNNAGNYLARGLYFIRIAAPDIDEIRKVMLIKD